MTGTYTPEEFARCFSVRGYGRMQDALSWLQEHGKEVATEEDFIPCYRAFDKEFIKPHDCRSHFSDGQNGSSPQRMKNSKGYSYNATMRYEQAINDAYDKYMRKKLGLEERT